MGGIKLNDTLNYNKKISHYRGLNNHFSKNAPEAIRKEFYMPKWEDDEKWKKVHKRWDKKIVGKGTFETYQGMRDACYELVNNDKNFVHCSETNGWCNDCVWGNTWS